LDIDKKNQCMLSITLKKYYSSPLKKLGKKAKKIINLNFLRELIRYYWSRLKNVGGFKLDF
jgi:hypothetical protein